ncbi:MAG: hypothetical protein IT385_07060 [Deltaproteobacteria bacterium]|nr:hypothetical protein [Deltaproteobacteria bacterium]
MTRLAGSPASPGLLARLAGLVLVLACASGARASELDLTRFVTREGSTYTLDEPALVKSFASIVTSLRPAFGATGGTTGARGLALEVAWAWTPIDTDAWRSDAPPDSLSGFHVEARKGLPAGLEVAAALSHASALDMTQASFALRWSWLEGTPGLPELGMRLDGGAILGHPQVSLFTVGLELVAGYPVPVAGLFRLAPYLGYAFRFARSIERRIAILDGVSADPFVTSLPGQNVFANQALIGLRIGARPLDLGIEASLGTTVGLVVQVGAKL